MSIILTNEQTLKLEKAVELICQIFETHPEIFKSLPKLDLKKMMEDNKKNNLDKLDEMILGKDANLL